MNTKGFTLLESLLALSITIVIVSLLPLFIQLLHNDFQKKEGLHMFEWEIFLQQAQMELRGSQKVTVSTNDLLFIGKEGERIMYEKKNGKLRRRVNGAGHEVLLQHVDTIRFIPIEQGIIIKVVDTTKHVYKRVITHMGTVEMIR
ncbi:competence type IV pilus minor pilin ComGF [Priestia taiwanensis]|nr:competence type IV pilus minor pilin ComGF [Priestia taiwanensis]MBM7363814.1 competence protein ComGF [Priestia taiwanensis]